MDRQRPEQLLLPKLQRRRRKPATRHPRRIGKIHGVIGKSTTRFRSAEPSTTPIRRTAIRPRWKSCSGCFIRSLSPLRHRLVRNRHATLRFDFSRPSGPATDRIRSIRGTDSEQDEQLRMLVASLRRHTQSKWMVRFSNHPENSLNRVRSLLRIVRLRTIIPIVIPRLR